jgi:CheY-like chemotaxis protein
MRPKVLVIEDNHEIAQVVTLLLGVEGIQVFTARNGEEGFNQCKALHPDLVVTDLVMPYLDGIELTELLRADPDCKSVPIIVLTAFAHEQAVAALKAGANAVLNKTGDYSFLIKMVEGFIRNPDNSESTESGKKSRLATNTFK